MDSRVRVLLGSALGLSFLLSGCERERGRAQSATAAPPRAEPVVPATLHVLVGFDDEGVLERPVLVDSAPGPYLADGEIYADVLGVVAVLAPGARVATEAGRLLLNGRPTGIEVRLHGQTPYASVRQLARTLGSYAHVNASGRHVTLWPIARLCEYRPRADTAAPVYRGAEAEGLFSQCGR